MPLYRYRCVTCNEVQKFLTDEPPEWLWCKRYYCGGDTSSPDKLRSKSLRDRQPSTYQNIEILDNGLSAKSVERYADAEKLFTERAEKNTLENQENG